MKENFKTFTFSLIFFASATVMGQTINTPDNFGKHEIYIGHGWNTVQEMEALFANIFGDDKATGNGAYCFGYRYHLNKNWAIGVSSAIENVKVTTKSNANNYSFKTFAAFLDVQHYYIQKPLLQVYSGIFAGYGSFKTNSAANENYNTTSFHITAIAVRVGKKIGVFGEAGFGYRGLVNVGISARL